MCLKIEYSDGGDAYFGCSMPSVDPITLEWQLKADGLSARQQRYYTTDDHWKDLKANGTLYFDWGATEEGQVTVICISKGQGNGWNQVEGKNLRGGQEIF